MMKKGLATIIVLALIITMVAACGGADEDKTFVIGYLGWDVNADWNTFTLGGLQWGAEQKGVEVIVLDARLDAERQVSQAEELISRGVDIIAMFPVTPESGATITRMANEAGIPITVENTFLPATAGEMVGQVACQYDDIGYAAVQYTAENFPGSRMLYVTGGLGLGVTEVYIEGVERALVDFAGLVEVVGQVNGEFVTEASYNVTQDFITSGQSEFDIVFAQNDAQAFGVFRALDEAGLAHIPIISTGGAPEGYDMLRAGQQQANMTAPANLQGIIQFKFIWAYLNGEPITNDRIPLPIIPIDLTNIDQWISWDDMELGYKYVADNIGPFVP